MSNLIITAASGSDLDATIQQFIRKVMGAVDNIAFMRQ